MKFASGSDVTSRFEGTIPSDRLAWVDTRIGDVENALMGIIPELRKPLEEIQERAEDRGDAGYVNRVITLVCDKVLQLYRNPVGAYQRSVTVDDVAESWSLTRQASSATISFTAEELAPVQFSECRPRSVKLVAWPEEC